PSPVINSTSYARPSAYRCTTVPTSPLQSPCSGTSRSRTTTSSSAIVRSTLIASPRRVRGHKSRPRVGPLHDPDRSESNHTTCRGQRLADDHVFHAERRHLLLDQRAGRRNRTKRGLQFLSAVRCEAVGTQVSRLVSADRMILSEE